MKIWYNRIQTDSELATLLPSSVGGFAIHDYEHNDTPVICVAFPGLTDLVDEDLERYMKLFCELSNSNHAAVAAFNKPKI